LWETTAEPLRQSRLAISAVAADREAGDTMLVGAQVKGRPVCASTTARVLIAIGRAGSIGAEATF
jgi:hypothetical protein